MIPEHEKELLSAVDKGIRVAWESPSRHSYRWQDVQDTLSHCKKAMESLVTCDSEEGIEKMANICMTGIEDGFRTTGIREQAEKLLKNSKNILAKFYCATLEEDIDKMCYYATQSEKIKSIVERLAARHKALDPYENTTSLLHAAYLSTKILDIFQNQQELETCSKRGKARLEAQEREAEEQKRYQEEQRRKAIQDMRMKLGQCVMCGNALGFLQKLMGKDRHGACTELKK